VVSPAPGSAEVEVARLAQLREGVGFAVRAGGKPIAVFKVGGEVRAIAAICPHWGGPLGEGTVSVERAEVSCPWHRFRYDLRTGRCVASNLRPGAAVYPVRVDGDRVYVTINDKDRA
jgi:nitrite reductase/ring-hydroxylating ferredoxin subunit